MTAREASKKIEEVSLILLVQVMPDYMNMYGIDTLHVNDVIELTQQMAARHVMCNADVED